MSPARFLCAIPVKIPLVGFDPTLPFNEKEITIKLSDIVSVLIVFDDKLPPWEWFWCGAMFLHTTSLSYDEQLL